MKHSPVGRFEAQHGLLQTKLLGRYYTPLSVAQSLVNWAVTSKNTRIFDPSYGGCAFFDASIRRLTDLGAPNPGNQLFGVDIDPLARKYLRRALESGGSPRHFLTADFLSINPSELGGPFDSVVGNPPYVRHHALAAKPTSGFSIDGRSIKLSRMSNYWAYFVLHGLQFVGPSGRLALVLPGSFIFADYGAPVRAALAQHFGNIYMMIVGEHLFPDAEEISVLVLAHGPKRSSCVFRVGYVQTAAQLDAALKTLPRGTVEVGDSEHPYARALVGSDAFAIYEDISAHAHVRKLGDLACVRIGTVTGCNEFFLLDRHQISRLRLNPHQCLASISRSAQLRGLRLSESDVARLSADGGPMWLLTLEDDEDLSTRLESYISKAVHDGISRRRKCRERDPWYVLPRCAIPDAFLPSMSFQRVHLFENAARITSTNTLHHVFWNREISRARRRSLTAMSLSTLFSLSAELAGRRYGGGLLKIEPSDACRLLLVNLDLQPKVLNSLADLTRAGRWPEAQEEVDELALNKMLGIPEKHLRAMRSAIRLLQGVRGYPV